MPTTEEVARYQVDPLGFAEDLILPAPTGPQRFGDIMADFQRERFRRLAPDLLALLRRQKPETQQHWWEATKGASKDTDLAVAVLWLLTFADRPLVGQIGAVDQKQAAELRMAATTILHENPWLCERVRIDKWVLSCPQTEAAVEILAADIAGSHGARPDVLILNELHAIGPGKKEFAENLMDNATKVPWGLRIVATNAGFAGTWQWQWREAARLHPERWYFHRLDVPAPWIAEADLAEAERRNSRTRFLRLWRGVWVSAAGDALDPDDLRAAVRLNGPQAAAQHGWVYVAGLDLGVKRDHSALVVLGTRPGDGRVAVASVRSWRPGPAGRVDLVEVREAVRRAAEIYGLACVAYDPHQAELMAQELAAAGVPTWEMGFFGRNLDLMASSLMQAFRQRMIDLYNEPELLEDLGRLTIVETRFGYRLTSTADESGHADRAIALAIALPVVSEIAALGEPAEEGEPLPGRVAA